ncbi:MAG: APC family permease [Chloroflexi bacterium]|nr:APC family permease [Chloroflexota bacterium]
MAITSQRIKRILIGEPFPTRAEIHERLDKVRALAIFASDPISSNAYATEAIMSVLVLMGAGALRITLPVGLAVMALVLLVVFSYTQTILHYPKGGGAYIVTKDNLGTLPSLFAAAALMIDYVLTVSVSVSAGIRAVTSAIPSLLPYSVGLALLAILLLTWINLRGMRESGTIFALPTYAFVVGVLVIIVLGLVRIFGVFGAAAPVLPSHTSELAQSTGQISQFLYIWLILRAFAAGCTALTGIEAISDGVAAFKPPESKNAATTMIAMGITAMTLFLGITFVATHVGLVPIESESILSQMAHAVTNGVPGADFIYGWVQLFTMLILILAANTGFQDFPRVGSFLAADGFMPRWVQNRGDRLVYNSGILMLAFLASIIVIIFRANEIHMLPLYALGVMLGFTLSQISMVKLFNKIKQLKPGETAQTKVTTIHYETHATWKRFLPAFGSVVTGLVLIALILTKFVEGAWIVVVTIPLLVQLFRAIRKHYDTVAAGLSLRDFDSSTMREYADVVIIPMGDIHRGTLRAIRYAKQFSPNIRAISIVTSPEQKERLLRRWNRFPDVTDSCELNIIDYDYRDILTPLVDYIAHVTREEFPGEIVTVIVPEFIPGSFWANLLHNQTANILRMRLRGYEDVAVVDVPYHLRKHKTAPPTATQPTNPS